MILMNKEKLRVMSDELWAFSCKLQAAISKFIFAINAYGSRLRAQGLVLITYCLLLITVTSCGVYTFKDVSIPPEVKTVKISYIENKARYVNPQLSPQLTDALTQKISNQTKLTRTQNDDANWQISGTVTNYSVSFSAVSGTQTTQNNLTVGVHIVFRDNLKDKTDEFDVSRDFPFSASLTLSQAEGSLQPQIIKNVSDEIFNHIFSNW